MRGPSPRHAFIRKTTLPGFPDQRHFRSHLSVAVSPLLPLDPPSSKLSPSLKLRGTVPARIFAAILEAKFTRALEIDRQAFNPRVAFQIFQAKSARTIMRQYSNPPPMSDLKRLAKLTRRARTNQVPDCYSLACDPKLFFGWISNGTAAEPAAASSAFRKGKRRAARMEKKELPFSIPGSTTA
jgi:hypothetical protein